MARFKVSSGELELILEENTAEEAAIMAVRIHDMSKSNRKLSPITLVQNLTLNHTIEDSFFLNTQSLIEKNSLIKE